MLVVLRFCERNNRLCSVYPDGGVAFGQKNNLKSEKGFVWHKKFPKQFSFSKHEDKIKKTS